MSKSKQRLFILGGGIVWSSALYFIYKSTQEAQMNPSIPNRNPNNNNNMSNSMWKRMNQQQGKN